MSSIDYYTLQDAYIMLPNTPSQYEHVNYPCPYHQTIVDAPITDRASSWDANYRPMVQDYPFPVLTSDGYRYPY